MRYLALGEAVELHRRLLEATGGASGIRDSGGLESAIAHPSRRSGASICATETFLILSGTEIDASVDGKNA